MPYIQVLFDWWREIGLITFLLMLVATGLYIGYGMLAEPNYRAVSTIAFIRQDSDIILDERFQTQSEGTALENALIRDSRRAALAGLAINGTVARAVVKELGDLLSEEEKNPALLMEQIEAEVVVGQNRTQSDLIELRVTTNGPIKSANIANTWAKHYVGQVNQLYGQSPNELAVAMDNELATSLAMYQAAQADLELFITTSQEAVLERQLAEKQNIVDLLQTNKEAIIQQQLQSETRTLRQLYVEKEMNHSFLGRAQHLQTQLDKGNEAAAATNSIALLLLKAQIFADPLEQSEPFLLFQETPSNAPLAQSLAHSLSQPLSESQSQLVTQFVVPSQPLIMPPSPANSIVSQLQLNVDSSFLTQVNATDQAQDVAALMTGLQTQLERLEEEIQTLASTLSQGSEYQPSMGDEDALFKKSISQLDLEIVQLQAKLEAENAHYQQLSQQRDLAWDAYQTLSSKVVELNLESAASNSEVRFASSAIPPAEPLPIANLQVSLPLVLLAGLMLGLFVAFVSTYLGRKPFLSRAKYQAQAS